MRTDNNIKLGSLTTGLKMLCASLLILQSPLLFTSCSDFFEPQTEDELDGSEYISSQTEMYTGFFGLMTKMQAVGDKEILLTETRGPLVEPTENSTTDLLALYNYNDNLKNNPYANPAGYYEVIMACNDYLQKMHDYRSNPNVERDKELWEGLVSSAVRIKVWAYKTLLEIYGQAIWFDEAITSVSEIVLGDRFQLLSQQALADRCLKQLDEGFDGVASDIEVSIIKWLDPSKVDNIANSEYRPWERMTPPYEGLYAELLLWRAAYLDAATPDGSATQAYYKQAADLLLRALNVYIGDEGTSGSKPYWCPNSNTTNDYKNSYWANLVPFPQENVSAIIYDYEHNQTNTLLHHFSNEYPNLYLLRPNTTASDYLASAEFNPGSGNDNRLQCLIGTYKNVPYLAKFRSTTGSKRTQPYRDDVQIYIYRAAQYHMMLAECMNHLHRYKALNALLNSGFNGLQDEIRTDQTEWEGFTTCWTTLPGVTKADGTVWSNRKYEMQGIRGCMSRQARQLLNNDNSEAGQQAIVRHNDLAVLDEVLIEFAAEGKAYPWMNRMAVRYADPSIVADRICIKYKDTGLEDAVRAAIMNGGNWVAYDLNVK